MKALYLSMICSAICLSSFGFTAPKDTTIKTAQVTAAAVGDMAPNFNLKDMSGRTVSLADYKGKTIILDFWATWCGPCKASFPGMKLAVNNFKNDKDVVFLFVDVSERQANYMELIQNFLNETQYPFTVIADGKDAAGQKNPIGKNYGITGIPTKVIIDKAGYIRFKVVGFNPGMSADDLASEVADMIKQARHPMNEQPAKAE